MPLLFSESAEEKSRHSGGDGNPRQVRLAQLTEILASMDEGTLAIAEDFLPMLMREASELRYASIAGSRLEPHPDYRNVAVMTNASNGYLQAIGSRHGISNITQDNGHRVLLLSLAMNVGVLPGRTGNDLRDSSSWEYELKTCSLESNHPCFTTNHHLNMTIIDKYRKAGFIFALYSRGKLVCAWAVHPDALASHFDKWEKDLLDGKEHHNNRTIPINHVREVGTLIYGDPLQDDWKAAYGVEERESFPQRDPSALNTLEVALELSATRWCIYKARSTVRMAWKRLETQMKAIRKADREARRAARAQL